MPFLSMLESGKLIPDRDQSQNQIDWSLAEGLSLHKIWLKSVDNFFETDTFTLLTLPLQLRLVDDLSWLTCMMHLCKIRGGKDAF